MCYPFRNIYKNVQMFWCQLQFFFVEQQPNFSLDRFIVKVCTRIHTHTHTLTHTPYNSSEGVISSSLRPLADNTQQTQDRNAHALSGIGNRDPNNQEATDLPSDRKVTEIGANYNTKYTENPTNDKM
jgi:hypothetical protein